MKNLKLYMILLGCTPKGRNTEQHDVFFGIGESLRELIPAMKEFWKDGIPLHIDAWREVNYVAGHKIEVRKRTEVQKSNSENKLFFINLGGYKPDDFEEYHYKMLAVSAKMSEATKTSRETAFYRHMGFKGGAASHIDDKYGVDIDDALEVADILDETTRLQFSIVISKTPHSEEDKLHIGYCNLKKLEQNIE